VKSDEQLVEEAKHGSEAAFTELVTRYQQKLLRFLVARSASRADAEDAVQDTFVNAYRYLDSYRPAWRFSTWLYRIAIRNAARQAMPATEEIGEQADPEADPLADCVEQSERRNLWLIAKRDLSADAFTALWLRYAEDMSVKEVAVALNRPVSWTKVTLFRSRNVMARALEAEDRIGRQGDVYGQAGT